MGVGRPALKARSRRGHAAYIAYKCYVAYTFYVEYTCMLNIMLYIHAIIHHMLYIAYVLHMIFYIRFILYITCGILHIGGITARAAVGAPNERVYKYICI